MKLPSVDRLVLLFGLAVVVAVSSSARSSASEGGMRTTPRQQALGISATYGKWDDGLVPWVYNATNAPSGFTDATATFLLIHSVLATWEGVCGLHFAPFGVDNSADIDDTTDNLVVFEWDAGIGGAAGVAGPIFNTPVDVLTEKGFHPYIDGTLRLNPNVFGLAGGESPADIANNLRAFRDTVLHEVGHLIGLGHSDNPKSRMYANPYNSIASLREDDIEACRSMYGYSDLYVPAAKYTPPPNSVGPSPFNSLILAKSASPAVAVNSITDGTDATLVVSFSVNGAFSQDVTAVAVDPDGFDSIANDIQISCSIGFICSGYFSISSFDRMREVDGIWTIHVIINGEVVATLPITVADLLPVWNRPPSATFSFGENQASSSRAVSATIGLTGDAEGNTATVTWHIPTQGVQSPFNVSTYPQSNTINVVLGDNMNHEFFVELRDDSARYSQDPPNNVGPAGAGFSKLYRYYSSGLNLGPDSDGDNSSDILWRHDTNGQVFSWQMHGNLIRPRGAVAVLSDLQWRIVSQGDFNGDGKSDIMWRHDVTGQVYYWQMNGSTIVSAASVVTPSDTNWRVIGDADYDGDGKADLIWRHAINGRIYLWRMNGPIIEASSLVAVVSDADWRVVADDDSDGDGRGDLTWMNAVTGQVYFWKMNGAEIVSAGQVAVISDLNWQVVAHGDYDGDGSSDLLWRHAQTGKVYYWQMSGSTILLSSRVSIVSDLAWKVVGSGDYNGDGRSDVLWRHSVSGLLYLWEQLAFITLRGGQVGFEPDLDWKVVNVN